jgi:hypothetical protein
MNERYEAPTVTVLGEVTEVTQKFGIYFDHNALQGSPTIPSAGPGVTFS